MLDKILFFYHGGKGGIPVSTYSGTVSGGISPSFQVIIILIFIGLIGWFFWKIKNKK